MTDATKAILQAAWSVVKVPLQILLVGLVVLLLLHLATWLPLPTSAALTDALKGQNVAAVVVGVLVFMTGISLTVFLWWLVSRFYDLFRDGKITSDAAATMKDLPLGLPEGTVRAILALLVAVVGLPILLFSKILALDAAIAGYINGIITGVFGFYFGTRTTGVPQQAMNQITEAQTRARVAETQRDQAQQTAVDNQAAAATVARASDFESKVDVVKRNLDVAASVLNVLGPALPPNLIPPGLKDVVSRAQTVMNAVQGVSKDAATDDHLAQLTDVAGALLGSTSGGTSTLGTLLTRAAPMLASVAIPGVGPVAGLGILLSVGYKLGSAEYQRWRARVLAAPLATGLIEFGTITPDEVHMALADAPIFNQAFASAKDEPGFDADLADAVLRDTASDTLWGRYGAGSQKALFADRAMLDKGLADFRQVLLARRAASDVPADLPRQVGTALAAASNPALRPAAPDQLNADTANQLIAAASKASAGGEAPEDARAAFDALVMLVGTARQKGIDLPTAIAEVKP